MDDRKIREQVFHDARFRAEHARASDRFYTITESSRTAYQSKLLDGLPGDRVLEFGCGVASSAFSLAARGSTVTAIDISPVAVELATHEAKRQRLDISFETMDAESLAFPEDSFDLVCGSGILHHLVLTRAYGELMRVLTPNGRAVFLEPLGHNQLVNWYRNRTPDQRTVDEHPLLLNDFQLARSFFYDVRVSYFHLATLAALPLCGTKFVVPLSRALDGLDTALFTLLPYSKRFAWVALVELRRPRKGSPTGRRAQDDTPSHNARGFVENRIP